MTTKLKKDRKTFKYTFFLQTILLLLAGILSHEGAAQGKSDFFVGLNSGKVIYAESIEYVDKTFGKDYLLLDDSVQYLLKDLKYYRREDGYYVKENIGMSGELWFKRGLEGKISTYSATQWAYVPAVGMNGMNYGMGHSSAIKHTYYQKGNYGLFQEVSYQNLQFDLKSNKESIAVLEQVRKMKTASTLTYVGAGAMIIAGFAHTASMNKQEGPPPYEATLKLSPMLFVGIIGIIIPSFIKRSKDEKLIEAISIYNGG